MLALTLGSKNKFLEFFHTFFHSSTFTVPNCVNAPSLSAEPLHGNIGTGSGRFWRELSGTSTAKNHTIHAGVELYGIREVFIASKQITQCVLSFYP